VVTGDSYGKHGISRALIIQTSECGEEVLTGRLICNQYRHKLRRLLDC